jgi:NAD(P)-dependent dehydrogenase (short-subunit alcohol dehydrogenase family)
MPTVRSVVITGASSGIGRGCALRMDALGWGVFAGVRKESDATALRAQASPNLKPLMLDVSDPQSIQAAKRAVFDAVGAAGLDAVVNNAAETYGGPIEHLDIARVGRVLDVNFLGVIRVTQAFMPLLRIKGGRIVNMSSISGWVASPFLSPYTTSKYALEALSDALRVELNPWQIHVAVIEPGAVNTPIWNKGLEIFDDQVKAASPEAKKNYGLAMQAMRPRFEPHGIPEESVVRAVEHALTSKRPKTRYPIGWDAMLVRIFRYFPDRWRDAFYLSWLRSK